MNNIEQYERMITPIYCKDCKKSARIEEVWVCMMRGELTAENGYCHKGEEE